MAETFGSGIDGNIVQQLNARTKLFSERKDPKQLQAINSNSAWIKVRSSVNIAGDNSKAKEFILSNSGNKEGIGNTNNSLYKADNRLGFRPAPGITGFNVSSKNTYGTLQEATINFNVWTLEDLEAAEQLYFRPGYSVLVEWGHSVFINNSSQIKYTNTDTILKPNQWFNSRKYSTIERDIKTLRDIYDGNYEGFLGLVVNFNWSYRNDGGYDCSIKVVSKNVVLESISIPPGSSITGDENNSSQGQDSNKFRRTIFHPYFHSIRGYGFSLSQNQTRSFFAGAISSLPGAFTPDVAAGLEIERTLDKSAFSLTEALNSKYEGKIFVNDLSEYTIYRLKIKGDKSLKYSDYAINYVPLRIILEIYNEYVCLKSDKEELVPFNLSSTEKYYTFGKHYTVLPYEVLMMKQPSGDENSTTYKYQDYYIKAFVDDFKAKGKDPNQILNLHVSTELILEELDKATQGVQEEGVGFLEFIKGVLSRIEYSLGDINQFDIVPDEFNTSLKIIDRKDINPAKVRPIINLTGLGSTLVDLNISSAISSNIASQIAIAAQSPREATKSNVATLLKWNTNLTDRHFFKKRQILAKDQEEKKELVYPTPGLNIETAELSDVEKEAVLKYADDLNDSFPLNKLWKDLNEENAWNEEQWDDLASTNIKNIQRLSDNPFVTQNSLPQGVVPVELTIKMLGLGGFKIGTTFQINKGILPAKYNNFGYIITGVEQEIGSDNKWYTTIKTQFYAIR